MTNIVSLPVDTPETLLRATAVLPDSFTEYASTQTLYLSDEMYDLGGGLRDTTELY